MGEHKGKEDGREEEEGGRETGRVIDRQCNGNGGGGGDCDGERARGRESLRRAGHPYVIADCGGAMEEAACHECGARIGGTQHRVRADNRTVRSTGELLRQLRPDPAAP